MGLLIKFIEDTLANSEAHIRVVEDDGVVFQSQSMKLEEILRYTSRNHKIGKIVPKYVWNHRACFRVEALAPSLLRPARDALHATNAHGLSSWS